MVCCIRYQAARALSGTAASPKVKRCPYAHAPPGRSFSRGLKTVPGRFRDVSMPILAVLRLGLAYFLFRSPRMEAQLYLLKPAPPGRKFKEDTQMERNPNQKTSLKKTFSTQNLVMMAALIAIQLSLIHI